MPRKILVTGALPYANGPLHFGHIIEAVQTDVWVRFQKLRGNDCLYVCAEDTHGTPIMIRAQQEGITPEQLIANSALEHQRDYAGFLIGFDHFHSTHSAENRTHTYALYTTLRDKGSIARRSVRQAYDEQAGMFLPDRYVRGTCPRCGAKDQYGDSCEVCGSTYSPADLKDAVSTVTGTTPVLRDSDHLFFKLGDYEAMLREWLSGSGLHQSVRAKLAEWFETGLKDWDISRDAPYFGFEIPDAPGKYFYVWFDAPIGYIGSFAALAAKRGLDFDTYWRSETASELHHFIGKDISYFHTLFWPAVLHGAGLRRPTGVHVHGFLTVDGQKMSKSRGTNITAQRYLELLPPEPLRYYFAAKLTSGIEDIDLSLGDFTARVNSDIVGKLVNIASRCAPFIERGGGRLADALPDAALYAEFLQASESVASLYETREYASAIREIMLLADRANQYVDQQKPWILAKDPAKLDEARAVATQAINLFHVLLTWLAPVLPQIAATAAQWLGAHSFASWDAPRRPLLGISIGKYPQLATRLDPAVVKQLIASPTTPGTAAPASAGARTATEKAMITLVDFVKLDLRAAKVLEASRVDGSDKLLALTLDLGSEQRQVFSGISANYKPEDLLGRYVVMIANLAPRKMRFGVSEGMVLCASGDGTGVFLLSADAGVAPGMKIS
ncbi:MAG TPA: methionine--tRNA ligase [Steroidobacteraceae bacterium]|nr:methionine--tRNA ligase [Steroidobacteraceae bacterium]